MCSICLVCPLLQLPVIPSLRAQQVLASTCATSSIAWASTTRTSWHCLERTRSAVHARSALDGVSQRVHSQRCCLFSNSMFVTHRSSRVHFQKQRLHVCTNLNLSQAIPLRGPMRAEWSSAILVCCTITCAKHVTFQPAALHCAALLCCACRAVLAVLCCALPSSVACVANQPKQELPCVFPRALCFHQARLRQSTPRKAQASLVARAGR